MIIINDTHLGAVRKGGTTPSSQESLRDYMFAKFSKLLNLATGQSLLIAGDLFDHFEIAPRDWIEAYHLLSSWCENNPSSILWLLAGNHDHSPKGSKVSSFEMLCEVLLRQHQNSQVIHIDSLAMVEDNVWALAHCSNQDVFDMKLEEALERLEPGSNLVLHANYANGFADNCDHSLNVKNDVAKEFVNRGVGLIFAHEHQARTEIPHGAREGCALVTVLGNQIPSSIADCLGNDAKYYWTINSTGLTKHECWSRQSGEGYAEIDWRSLQDGADVTAAFVRITGEASSLEAATVVDVIHKYRLKANALVVGNAVKVEGIVEIDELPATFEAAKKFDVMQFIYGQLDNDERKVIEKIVEELQ